VVTLKVSEGAAYGAALQSLWCWQQQQGEACSIDALTDRFVKVDRAAVAKPNTRNAARYQDLQVLQDQTALALSKVFSRHRAITEQG